MGSVLRATNWMSSSWALADDYDNVECVEAVWCATEAMP
jgi:hypothetical protein